jgi:hypothetical protein
LGCISSQSAFLFYSSGKPKGKPNETEGQEKDMGQAKTQEARKVICSKMRKASSKGLPWAYRTAWTFSTVRLKIKKNDCVIFVFQERGEVTLMMKERAAWLQVHPSKPGLLGRTHITVLNIASKAFIHSYHLAHITSKHACYHATTGQPLRCKAR